VITNLVDNAIKFTQKGEIVVHIYVDAQAGGAMGVIDVSDSGIGISPEKLDLIFDAFSQEDSSTTRRFGGTGLGLSISRHLVSMMAGHIQVKSTLGVGSTFTIRVPLDVDPHPPQESVQSLELRGLRVLAVDDNATNLRILHDVLLRLGVEVDSFNHSEQALAYCQTHPRRFDALLVDQQMPGIDGFALVAAIDALEAHHKTPVLMLSSCAMPGDMQRCQEAGIKGFLLKPWAPNDFSMALNSLLQIPIQADAPSAPLPSSPPPSLRILVAEDNATNQLLAEKLLGKWGHQLVMVGNGQEAVERYRHKNFDLILMDVQMPLMSGLEATEEIRKLEAGNGRHIPIIAMTANAMEGDRECCLEAGMDDYLSKPLQVQALREVLQRVTQARVSIVPAFDYRQALHEADQEVIGLIALHFLQHAPEEFLAMRRAWEGHDGEEVQRLAHSLKGLFLTFGATPAAQLAQSLEVQVKAGHAGKVVGLINNLDREFAVLAPYLQEVVDAIAV